MSCCVFITAFMCSTLLLMRSDDICVLLDCSTMFSLFGGVGVGKKGGHASLLPGIIVVLWRMRAQALFLCVFSREFIPSVKLCRLPTLSRL